ncbi:hypothetical protein B6U99_01635 [Candidatus Geothermarchaeota archaeon ex4572_27]|nr:MAG: hypothetical protein B6U99_01635 [Candidatus Geothermarchaeota archaeon ex4572_27]
MIDIHSTEPGCGTDFTAITTTAQKKDGTYVIAITTTAQKKDGTYVINGEKQFVSLIPEITTYGGGFFVPYNAKGLTPTRFETLGLDIGGMKYDNVEVPDYYLLGEENKGYGVANESFILSRVPLSLVMTATAMRCVEEAMNYMKQREAFGRPIAAFGMMQHQLADTLANLEAARWLAYYAGWVTDQYLKGNATLEQVADAGAKAKLFASKYAIQALHDVLEWYGALGLTTEIDMHMAFRSMRMITVAEGTMNAMRIIIAMNALGREYIPWRWVPKK